MKRSITLIALLLLAVFNLQAGDCVTPGGLNAEAGSETEVFLSWEAVSNAIAYRLKIEDANNNPIDFVIEITVSSNSYLATNLTPGAHYKFKVRTVCEDDHSDWTDWYFFSTELMAAIPGNISISGIAAETEQTDLGFNLSVSRAVEINLFPNPAHDIFTLDLARLPEGASLYIQLFDSMGRPVWRRETTGGPGMQVQVPVAQLEAGLYQVILKGNGLLLSKKLLVTNQ